MGAVTATVRGEGPWRTSVHAVAVDADPDTVFGLLSDVRRWPWIFGPTVHADYLERDGATERLRIWATAGERVRGWTSVRTRDTARRRISFQQSRPPAPVAAMTGEWRVAPSGPGTRVELRHEFRAVADSPADLDRITEAVDRNSTAELGALAAAAGIDPDELLVDFTDTVELPGPAAAAYALLRDAGAWPALLPHVRRVRLREEDEGVQWLEMDTAHGDEAPHTTVSVRLCLPPDLIVYKQLTRPAFMAAHTGSWRLAREGGRLLAHARHTVLLDRAAALAALGGAGSLAQARARVRAALGGNSRATLERIAQAAGSAV
ncbi:aromatase/cyclase [Streptomonospora nanhaiensis]|uniref:aromatase/cyclase n=1 Tax=Streptomonospora nanhaiensis TaxID=1323731 RepID=UPI001C384DC0|nr:SRPBCC family protein [Streptomonospora nanhaiensis]MBV2365257.1 SRPBCC family protein [Streptomonospora nanhaiensis]